MIRGLTLHRPWAWAIASGYKHIENRTWPFPKSLRGCWLAIHGGKRIDWTGVDRCLDILQEVTAIKSFRLPEAAMNEGILGVVKVEGVTTQSDSPWYTGPYGWVLKDAVMFKDPIQARGYQGLWTLSEEFIQKCRDAYDEAVKQ